SRWSSPSSRLQTVAFPRPRSRTCVALSAPCVLGLLGFRPLFLAFQAVEGLVHGLPLLFRLRRVLADLEVDLFAEDGDGSRCLNPDPDLLAHDRKDRDLYLVPDHDALV